MTSSNTYDNGFNSACGSDDCHDELTRRNFGAWALAAGFVAATRSALAAEPVKDTDVTIKTADGMCDAYLLHPEKGTHHAVIMWPDIGGIRPVFREMGKRLAAEGYTVLVANPFYRAIKGEIPADMPQDQRGKLRDGLAGGGVEKDVQGFVSFLDGQAAVKKGGKMGAVGFCMSGPFTLRAAATVPARFGAIASFHGAGLASDQPDSPHLLASKIKAKALICIADGDDQKDPEAKNKLKAAFDAAKNPADIEVYTGANHGWTVPGSRVYNEAAAEKAWGKMLALFKTTLA